MPKSDIVLDVQKARKSFGSTVAVNDVSLTCSKGQKIAILGPNGAGKSTLFSLIFGLRQPESGQIQILGGSPKSHVVRRHLGATPQETNFPNRLKVKEVLQFVGLHYPHGHSTEHMIQVFDLVSKQDSMVGSLSGGQKRRVALACAFIGKPLLIILDEPSTGLDIESRHRLFDFIKSESEQRELSLIYSTHHYDEVDLVADYIYMLNEGRIFIEGTVDEIKSRTGFKKILIPSSDLINKDQSLNIQKRAADKSEIWSTQIEADIEKLKAAKVPLDGIEIHAPTLEETYIHLRQEQNQ